MDPPPYGRAVHPSRSRPRPAPATAATRSRSSSGSGAGEPRGLAQRPAAKKTEEGAGRRPGLRPGRRSKTAGPARRGPGRERHRPRGSDGPSRVRPGVNPRRMGGRAAGRPRSRQRLERSSGPSGEIETTWNPAVTGGGPPAARSGGPIGEIRGWQGRLDGCRTASAPVPLGWAPIYIDGDHLPAAVRALPRRAAGRIRPGAEGGTGTRPRLRPPPRSLRHRAIRRWPRALR